MPFGLNVGLPTKETKDMFGSDNLTHMGADVGVDAQIGYMISVKEGFGISLLAELGYSFDSYGYGYKTITPEANKASYWQYYHSFKLGLLPKFNIGVGKGAIAIGIGGGAKIPLAGKSKITATIGGVETKTEVDLKRQDIVDLFSPSVIGYLKVTFDYYLFFTDNIGMNFGLYLGGDFAPKSQRIGVNAFDFGLQLGFRFGPKA
ncbi:PorT family protein [Brachyspira aalborgi]|uniref:PorT family protein n=1 Tax=Brachyspira aalborgi TaxID=29522 RepID=UPI001F550C3F|nr:PorT family protein [Brachyspira aalborgi]